MTDTREQTPWWTNVTAALAQMKVLFNLFKVPGDSPDEPPSYGWELRFTNPEGFAVLMLAEESWLHVRMVSGVDVAMSVEDLLEFQMHVLHCRLVRGEDGTVMAQADIFHDLVSPRSITVALGALATAYDRLRQRQASTPQA